MRSLLFAFIALFSFSALAADYTWTGQAGNGNRFTDSSPLSVCTSIAGQSVYPAPTPPTVSPIDSVHLKCTYYNYANSSKIQIVAASATLTRSGTGCTAPSVYDAATFSCSAPVADIGKNCGTFTDDKGTNYPKIVNSSGACVSIFDADKPATCKSLAGQTITPKVFVHFTDDGTPVAPQVDVLGCETKNLVEASCKLPAARTGGGISLAPAGAYCNVAVSYTGNVTPGSSGSSGYPSGNPDSGTPGLCGDNQDCSAPEQPKLDEKQPCNYTYDAEGRKTCSSLSFTAEPGSMNCGSVNGAFSCTPKVPTSNGIQIGTTIKDVANADGTTTSTKTDVAVITTCAGYNSCKSTTTTNKTVVIKDGNGNQVSSTGTCTGANCATAGNPDGNGDGLGDCTRSDCKPGEGNVAGPGMPELKAGDTMSQTNSKFMARVQQSPLMASISTIHMPSGGACNVGSAQTFIGAIDFNSFCQNAPTILNPLRYLFLAIWAWAAVRLFFTA